MKNRRGSSLWPETDGLASMIYRFEPGDLVVPVTAQQDHFIGVVKEVLLKLNKVMVLWNGGSLKQHDPDEIMLEAHQNPIVRTRMATSRRVKNAQHLVNVKALDPLTGRELTRALRDAIIAENEAIKQYETVVDSTDDAKVKEVLQDISDEERVHIGEIQALLKGILDDEQELLEEGEDEVEEMSREAGVIPGVPDGTGPHGWGNENSPGPCPYLDEDLTASEKTADQPPHGDMFVGDPDMHGIDSPRGGGFSIMQDLQKDLHKEQKKESEAGPKIAGCRRGTDFFAAEGGVTDDASLKSRRAMYWGAPDRVYRLTKEEQEKGSAICPRCKKEMALEPFTKSEKLYLCQKCGFKVPTSKTTTTRITIDVDKGTGEVDVDVTTAKVPKGRRGSL
jgi:predicted RNA-binding Zn-ribbon protein involved in translation (DUF1610 family)